ncbi:MAG TPA: STAS domain-containing protein [Herpetosiphonaceae bacterium]|nr:STAS domain-containing protein [Herpetosiphonaceae bacterium]
MNLPTITDADPDLAPQIQRLSQFLKWLTLLTFAFVPCYAVILLIAPNLTVAIAAAIVLGFGALLGVALRLVRRNRLMPAVAVTCASFLALAVAFSLAVPALYDVFMLVIVITIAVALPYVSGRAFRNLGLGCLAATLLIALLGEFVQLLPPPPRGYVQFMHVSGFCGGIALILLLLWQFGTRLTQTLAETRQTNQALAAAHGELESRVERRTSELSTALAELRDQAGVQRQLLSEIDHQRTTIRELSIPVLPVSASTLVIPLVGALDAERLNDLQQQALHAISQRRARRLVLDITGLAVVDSHVAQGLRNVMQAATLLGTQVALVGVRPDVAQTMVHVGLGVGDVATYRDLQSALAS